jgi:hypothetical protein
LPATHFTWRMPSGGLRRALHTIQCRRQTRRPRTFSSSIPFPHGVSRRSSVPTLLWKKG